MSDSAPNFVGASRFDTPSPDAILDVVFLHGLTGDRFGTWQIGANPDTFWPAWLAADLSMINVYTAGFDSSVFAGALVGDGASLIDRSTILLDSLISRDCAAPAVVFVAHSLGGLIVKQMLRKCNDSVNGKHKALLAAVKGIAFIGTPHQGAGAAKALDTILRVLLSKSVKQLAYGEDALLDLNEWFRHWAGQSGICVAAYYETKKTKGVSVVDKVTANPNVYGCDPIAVDADHICMCKPASREAQLYRSVSALVREVAKGRVANGNGGNGAGGTPSGDHAEPALPAGPSASPACSEDLDPEVLVDFQNFTATAPGDRRTLAQKLEDGGRAYEVPDAERKKERFNMTLQRNIAQPSALTRVTQMMSEVETRFNRHARQAIVGAAPPNTVNRIVQQDVIDPTVKAHSETGTPVTPSLVESALYYLTGNCHIRWDNVKD